MSPNQKSRSNRSGRNHKQNNRNRNHNNRNQRKGSGRNKGQAPLTATRQVDSHGPEGKLRGNVKQLYDQYKALSREFRTKDATTSEALGQFAHHYYTLYSEFAAAEAAEQLEKEREKERQLQEAAENQANILKTNGEADESDEQQNTDVAEEKSEKKADKPQKRRRSKPKINKEDNTQESLDLNAADEPVPADEKKNATKKQAAE